VTKSAVEQGCKIQTSTAALDNSRDTVTIILAPIQKNSKIPILLKT